MRTLSKIQIILFTVMIMVSITISAYGVDGQIKLTQPVPPASFPIEINASGSYVLTSNLVVTADQPDANAIEITVNDVTLDLNGHMIQGPNTGSGNGSGIYASNRNSITIKNGRIWGFGKDGIYLEASENDLRRGAGHIIKDVQVLNNGENGMVVYAAVIINCTASNNATGVFGGRYGINAQNSTIVNCTSNNNHDGGINVVNSTIVNCTANYNEKSGIECIGSTVTNCTLIHNGLDGVSAFGLCRIVGNNLIRNDRNGLTINGNGNYVIKNVASENVSAGFIDGSTPGNRNYMPVIIHNPSVNECSGNDNCEFLPPPPPNP